MSPPGPVRPELQDPPRSPRIGRRMTLEALLARPGVRAARAAILASGPRTLREQLRIVEIPAPPLQETARGAYLLDRFAAIGLASVGRDEVGNVLGLLPAAKGAPRRPLVVAAHLDTVFPAGTDVTPRWAGGRIFAPGIADNARGLAALLGLANVLRATGLRTMRPVLFVATVGEEGIGDLRGTKHLFADGAARDGVHGFIALDGSGVRRIVHRAIGARRLRVTLRGPGGHSWSDWGVPNPVHALGAAIAELRALLPLREGRSTLTVARVGGGTSVNAIPGEAWLELDMRSEDPVTLAALERDARAAVKRVVESENAARRAGTPPLTARLDGIGDRPSGAVAADAPLVAAAQAATRAVGARPELSASSTDANVPIALGVPAITIGAGGESGGIHTLDEWYADEGGARGLDRALVTVLAAAGGDG